MLKLSGRIKTDTVTAWVRRYILCALFVSVSSNAQQYVSPTIPNPLTPLNDTGVQVYGVYDGVRDNVGLSNGNLNIQIPLLKLPQRAGGYFELSATYDSLAAINLSVKYLGLIGEYGDSVGTGVVRDLYSVSFSTESDVASLPGVGWRLGLPVLSTQWGVGKTRIIADTVDTGLYHAVISYCWNDWVLTLADGSKHYFANQMECTYSGNGIGDGVQAPVRTVSDSNDGTYMRLDTSDMSNIIVYLRDGSEYHFYYGANGLPGVVDKIIDRNGNIITTQKNNGLLTNITDSVGRVISITPQSTSSSNVESMRIAFKDANGNNASIAFTAQQGGAGSVLSAQRKLVNCLTRPGGYNPVNPAPSALNPLNLSMASSYGTMEGTITIQSSGTSPIIYKWTEDGADDLIKIAYPAGGYTRYEYSAIDVPYKSGGMICDSLTVPVVSSKHECSLTSECTGDQESTTSYAYDWKSYAANGATVQYPDGTKIIHTFAINPTMQIGSGVQSKDGPQYSMVDLWQKTYDKYGSLIKAVAYDYTSGSTCPSAGSQNQVYLGALPCRVTTTLYDGASPISSKVEKNYSPYTFTNPGSYGYSDGSPLVSEIPGIIDNPLSGVEYGYDGSIMRTISNSWASLYGNNNHNYNVKTQETVTDPVSGVVSQTKYGYDYYPNGLSSTGAINHASVGALRGNITEVQRYISSSSYLSYKIGYDDSGNIISVQDPKNNTTTWSYDDNFTNSACAPTTGAAKAYVTRKTNAFGQSIGYSINSCYGNMASSQDLNGNITSYGYDGLGRVTSISYPDKGMRSIAYNDSLPVSITASVIGGPTTKKIYDGLNREVQDILSESSISSVYADKSYDPMGRIQSESNAYRSTSDITYGIKSYLYDSLGRLTYHCDSDNNASASSQCVPNNSYLKWSYAANLSTRQDEIGNQSQSASDALGRVISVLTPDGVNRSYSAQTQYIYDALGSLTSVNQAGNSGGTARIRAFAYDWLSRLTSSQNPENGTVFYTYDENSNVQTKTDARGVVTHYSYDALNRMLSRTYTNAPAGTMSNCYQYDTATNGIGHLGAEWTQAGSCSSAPPSTGYQSMRIYGAYDAMGRIVSEQQCVAGYCTSVSVPTTPAANCSSLTSADGLQYCYDLTGNLLAYSNGITTSQAGNYPQQALLFSQAFDGAGRLASVNSSWTDTAHPSVLFSAQEYTPFNSLANWLLGNHVSATRSYDNRLRIKGQVSAKQ